MEYISTPKTVKGFLNALAWCSELEVGAWMILYTLVKLRGCWTLLIVVSKVPCSLSVNFVEWHID